MRKAVFVFLIALFAIGFCFAQSLSTQVKALQGTWALIGILNDAESYDETVIKAGKVDISYVFKNNELTIKKYNETIGPVKFDAQSGYIYMGSSEDGKLPYNLQGNILIIHEGGSACIYRKR